MCKDNTELEYTTPQELAQRIGMTADAICRWIRQGHLQASRATPRSPYRIARQEADDLVMRMSPPPDRPPESGRKEVRDE